MRFFFCVCKMEWRCLLRDKHTILCLLLFPLGILCVNCFLPAENGLPAVPVGWVMPANCEYGDTLFSLIRQETGFVEFISTDADTLRINVASGKWACGFILREDFDERLEKQRWSKLFTLVHSDNATISALISESVSSAMLTMISPMIGKSYLENEDTPIPEDGWFLEESLRLEIQPVYEGKSGSNAVAAGINRNLLKGIVGILLSVLSMSMGEELAMRRTTIEYQRVSSIRGELSMLIPILMCRCILLFSIALLSLISCGGADRSLLGLCVCLTGIVALLSELPIGWSTILLPFLPPILLILCPVLFDVSALLPALKPVCALFPVTHYLRGTTAPNLLMGAIFFALALALYRKNAIRYIAA